MNMIRFSILAVAFLIAGCTAGPDYHRPAVDVPPRYSELPTSRPTTSMASIKVDLAHWWEAMNDPELDSLLRRAADTNLDLQVAIARLQGARTAEAVFTGSTLPSLNYSSVAGVGTGTNQATGGLADGPLNAAVNPTGLRQVTQVLGVDTSFEADIFGNLRREAEAVSADAAAAGEFRNQVLVTLLADVARQYVAVRTFQLRLDIANRMVAALKHSADLEHQRFKDGIVNRLDTALADRELASARATVDPLRAQLLSAQRAIAVLLGEEPDTLIPELNHTGPLPTPPQTLDAGLPGDLLRRRPDVRQAEAQLIASNARLGVATADLYPRLYLSASAGSEGQGLGREPIDWRFIWTVAPTLDYPLLDFGTADARRIQADQAVRGQVASFRKTILTAVQQVDDNLSNYDADRGRMTALDQAVVAAREALTIATERYNRGIIDFLNVIDSQRQLFSLQDQYAVSEQQAVSDFVGVCQSLGGGWQGFPPPPPLQQPLPAVLATLSDVTGHSDRPLNR